MTEQPLIFAHELTRRFGDVIAVDHVSLTLERGAFFGLLGPNGAGKTTLMEMITCQLKPTSGNASVLGFDVEAEKIKVKKQIGIMAEEPKLFGYLTVQEMITFVGRLYDVPKAELSKRVRELLGLLSLVEKAHKLCRELSHGMKRKVELACALVHKPLILFLDEPFSGIDPVDASTIKNILQDLAKKGVTIWLNSHLLFLVEELCEQIAILHQGRLLAQGPVNSVKQQAPSESLEQAFFKLTGLQPKESTWSSQ